MIKLNATDKKLVISLYKSNRSLEAFTLFRRLKINFTDFLKSVSRLQELLFVEENQNRIALTEEGFNWALRNLNSSQCENKHWRNIPEKYFCTKIDENDFYIPSKKLLDRRTFPFLKNDVE